MVGDNKESGKHETSEVARSGFNKPIKTNNKKQETFKKNYAKKEPSYSNIPDGFFLEYRVKRLLYKMGYYSKVGITMKTSQEETAVTITDLDVFGIYVHRDFTSKSIWADCKSGRAKVHERISWIKGIMSTLDINDVIFVKEGIRTEVKQYARKYGIRILDLRIIEKLEKDFNIEKDDWSGSWNPYTQYEQLSTFSKVAIPTNDLFKKIANFISADYWVLDNFSRAKKVITAVRELSSILDIPIPEEQLVSVKWAINELICLFLLSVLNIAKELYYLNEKEKKEAIYDALTSGDVPNKQREDIFKAAFKVAYSMVQRQIPEFKPPVDLPPINLNPPGYSEAFYDLIIRITTNPLHYYDLLRFLDYILMEFDLQSKSIHHDLLRSMFPNYDDLMIGAKTILHFISQITGVTRSYFQVLK